MSDFTYPLRFNNWAKYINYLILLLGLTSLLGWEFDIELLKQPFHSLKPVSPTSALCFLLFGVSTHLMGFSTTAKTKSLFGYALLISILSISLLQALTLVGMPKLHINILLFVDTDTANGWPFGSAFNFVLLSMAMLFTFVPGGSNKTIANFLALILLLIALFSIIIYLYRVSEFFEALSYFTMALYTAFGFVLAAVVILFINSESGFIAVISNPGSGGTTARILFPAAIIAPIVIGLLRLTFFQWEYQLSVELGVSVLITSIIFAAVLFVFYVANIIVKKDALRLKAEENLVEFNKDLEIKIKNRTDEILRRENRFKAIIENSTDAILLTDENLQLIYQSPAVERMTGISEQERRNNSDFHYTHPEDIPKIKQWLQQAIAQPEIPIPFQIRFLHKSGTPIWIEGVMTNLLHDESVRALVFNYRNINERKEAEEKIATSELRFRILIENNADVISLTDKNLKVTYQSPQGEKITGYTQEERAALDAKDLLHPEDIRTLMEEYPKLFTNPENPISFHYRFKHKLGHYIWLEGSIKNLLNDPNIGAIVVNFRDVSERKSQEEKIAASEQRFRTLIENNFDCILLTKDDAEVIYQSPSVERVTGYANLERGSGFYNIHPDDVENAKFLHLRLREKPGVPIRFQLRFSRKNGEYMWAEGVATNLLHDPRVHAIVTNFRDITEQKTSETEILKLNAELEERVQKRTLELQNANKELESFSYSVSHDLRAPLRIINGFSQILADDYYEKLDHDGQQIIGRITKNAQKMGQLIDDLLGFSRLGRAEMRLSTVNMSSLVQDVLSELEAGGIPLPKNLKIHTLRSCRCDSVLIKQVWINLISNAIKYSGKVEPVIEIGMTSDNRPAYFVKDNGAGFDMNYAHKLFGVFQRLHKAEEFEGTGVGLAIVQRVIARHGGEVWAEAKENEGATFYFHIPE